MSVQWRATWRACAPFTGPARSQAGDPARRELRESLPAGHDGGLVEAEVGTAATFAGLPGGTYSIEALGADGSMLAEELTTVGVHAGERPVHGFATSFEDEDTAGVLEWLRELRCTVVQIYDWMSEYTAPLGPEDGWRDPSGRPVSLEPARPCGGHPRAGCRSARLRTGVRGRPPFRHRAPRDDAVPRGRSMERFFDMIKIANPADKQWQRPLCCLLRFGRGRASVLTVSTSTRTVTHARPSTRAGSPLICAWPTRSS